MQGYWESIMAENDENEGFTYRSSEFCIGPGPLQITTQLLFHVANTKMRQFRNFPSGLHIVGPVAHAFSVSCLQAEAAEEERPAGNSAGA